MAEHPLAGIAAKLERAREDLNTLHSEFQTFLYENPLNIAFKFDAKTEWHTAYIESVDPPPRFAILAGESIFHMRSCFEHLVWALVKANRKKPGEHNSFPIWESGSTKTFIRNTCRAPKGKRPGGKLYGVRRDAVALIEKLQPYNAGNHPPDDYFLVALNELARVDRHRTLHGTYIAPDFSDLRTLFVPIRRAEIIGFRNLLRPGRRVLVNGTHIAKLRLRPASRQAKVKVQGELPTAIGFGDRHGLVGLDGLNDLYKWTVKTIGPFERFLV